MHRLPRLAALASLLALAAACGGTTGSSSFAEAAPSYGSLAMDLTDQDRSEPTLGVAASALSADAVLPLDCHPHLFVRTHDLVRRVNRHLWRALRHAERVIARNPTLATGAEQVWERTENGIDVKFTMTRSSDVVFTWKLEMKKVADAAFTTVVTGDIDRTGAAGPHQGTGEVTIDLSALASVNGDDVAGTLTAKFTSLAGTRTLVVDAQNVVWDTDSPSDLARQEKSAHYVYERKPGIGGSLKVEGEMVFLCPANASLAPATVDLVSRWYRTSTGSVHGRSDANMTGGQIAAGDKVVGVTCHDSAVDGGDQAESFWLMKLENPDGTTVTGGLRQRSVVDSTACDPALNPPTGNVPNLDDATTDFDMSGIVFTDSTPYPFPGSTP
jgi:hypothetical protein